MISWFPPFFTILGNLKFLSNFSKSWPPSPSQKVCVRAGFRITFWRRRTWKSLFLCFYPILAHMSFYKFALTTNICTHIDTVYMLLKYFWHLRKYRAAYGPACSTGQQMNVILYLWQWIVSRFCEVCHIQRIYWIDVNCGVEKIIFR